MKLQKNVAIISGIVSVLSLAISFIFTMIGKEVLDYLSNIFIGLFSSGVLMCAVAIITYFSERNKMLYHLYCVCLDFSQVFPFGKYVTSQDDFLALRPEAVQAISIYNKEMQFSLDELSALRRKSGIACIISAIKTSSLEIYNAILELNDEISSIMCNKQTFSNVTNKKLKICTDGVMEASEKYAKAVSDLATFIKDKKIHKWEKPKNTH